MGTGKNGSVTDWYHPRDTTSGGEVLLEILRLCEPLVRAASPHADRARATRQRKPEPRPSRQNECEQLRAPRLDAAIMPTAAGHAALSSVVVSFCKRFCFLTPIECKQSVNFQDMYLTFTPIECIIYV